MTTDYLELYDATVAIKGALQSGFGAPGVLNPPAIFRVQVGSAAIPGMDDCCRGELTLLVGESTPFEGSEDLQGTMVWTQRYAAVLFRCQPTIDNMGNEPTPAEDDAALKQVLYDRQLIMRTLRTFFTSQPYFCDGDYTDITATQVQAEGGCCGTLVEFSVPIIEDC